MNSEFTTFLKTGKGNEGEIRLQTNGEIKNTGDSQTQTGTMVHPVK